MKHKSYKQFCGLAYGLDVIGERWTLLIVRELLAGPRRFKDLLEGLPDVSTNLLSERLKRLEQQGIVSRRVLLPPAGSSVYELTAVGQGLEKAVLELGKWGSQFLPPSLEGVALPSSGATALAIKAFFHPEQAQDVHEIYELHLGQEVHLGHEVLQVQINDGEIRVQQGQALPADVVLHTEMPIFMGLFSGQIDADAAIAGDLVQVEGDADGLRRFLQLSRVTGASQ
jgi:DNA-binding HxlR family transcriptional regulator